MDLFAWRKSERLANHSPTRNRPGLNILLPFYGNSRYVLAPPCGEVTALLFHAIAYLYRQMCLGFATSAIRA